MERQKIKSAAMYVGKSLRQVAEDMGLTPQNLNYKLTEGMMRDKDYEALAESLGGKYVSYIEFPDGTKI